MIQQKKTKKKRKTSIHHCILVTQVGSSDTLLAVDDRETTTLSGLSSNHGSYENSWRVCSLDDTTCPTPQWFRKFWSLLFLANLEFEAFIWFRSVDIIKCYFISPQLVSSWTLRASTFFSGECFCFLSTTAIWVAFTHPVSLGGGSCSFLLLDNHLCYSPIRSSKIYNYYRI